MPMRPSTADRLVDRARRTGPALAILAVTWSLPCHALDPTITDGIEARSGGGTIEQTIYFEDFEAGPGGWIASTPTEGVRWFPTTEDLGDGPRAVWRLGQDNPCFAGGDGYGNYWFQRLAKAFSLGTAPIQLDVVHQYDTEAGYDICAITVTDLSGNVLQSSYYSGNSGGYVADSIDLSAFAGQTIEIRLDFTSDGGWSDEDGFLDTNGPWRVDSVGISGVGTDTFDSGGDGWTASRPSLPTEAPIQFALELDPPCDSGMFLNCFDTDHAWTARNAVLDRVPEIIDDTVTRSPILASITSPPIAVPTDATQLLLEMDVFSDTYPDAGTLHDTFYLYRILSTGSDGCARAASDGFVYYNGLTGWLHRSHDITSRIAPGATEFQIELCLFDATPILASRGIPENTEPQQGPYFDNVAVIECIPAGAITVSGVVRSGCGEGPLAGVDVTLVDGDGVSTTIQTAADGSYAFDDVTQTTANGTVSVVAPFGFDPAVPAVVVLDADQAGVDFDLACQYVDVSGVITSDCGGPLLGVTVDLDFDPVNPGVTFWTVATDETGAYAFEDVRVGADDVEITAVVPLGYQAIDPSDADLLVSRTSDAVVDFSLACLDPTGSVRSKGYWKHQAKVYLKNHGSAQESETDMATTYPGLIFDHFHDNELSAVVVEGITYELDGADHVPLSLETVHATLIEKQDMLDRARQQYMALLLNIASGKLLTSSVISDDGGTASQALQQIAAYLEDGDTSNDELAKDIADTINNATQVAAGVIDLSYGDVAYRPGVAPARFAVALVANPTPARATFRLMLPEVTAYRLSIHDAAGRLVHEQVDQAGPGVTPLVWDGRGADGRPSGAGVYFYRVTAGDRLARGKLTLVR